MEDGSSPNKGVFDQIKKIFHKNSDAVTEQEIISMVEEGHDKGFIQKSEVEMIHNIFELDDLDAKDIMTHRKHMCALDGNLQFQDAIDFILEQPFSRFPVYLDDLDNIIGTVHIKDILAVYHTHKYGDWMIKDIEGLVHPADFVPETIGIQKLFGKMQAGKNHLVIVVDEYGQTAGLVALEDILEEIVGNILDEHDKEEQFILAKPDGSFLMDGAADLEEVATALQLDLDENENDTLNGYLISLIDKIPTDGENFTVEALGYDFEVLSVEDKMIRQVLVKKSAKKSDAEQTDACNENE